MENRSSFLTIFAVLLTRRIFGYMTILTNFFLEKDTDVNVARYFHNSNNFLLISRNTMFGYMQCYFSLKKRVPERIVTKYSVGEEGVPYTDATKNDSETPTRFSSFRERTSGTTFRRVPSQ